jgi:hypothetical protein
MKRWGWFLGLIISAPSMLIAIPGIFLAPTLTGKSVSVGLIVGYGLIFALLLPPAARAAFAAKEARLAV